MKKNRNLIIDSTIPQHVLFHKDETYESGPRNRIMALNPEYIFEGADLMWVNMFPYISAKRCATNRDPKINKLYKELFEKRKIIGDP